MKRINMGILIKMESKYVLRFIRVLVNHNVAYFACF